VYSMWTSSSILQILSSILPSSIRQVPSLPLSTALFSLSPTLIPLNHQTRVHSPCHRQFFFEQYSRARSHNYSCNPSRNLSKIERSTRVQISTINKFNSIFPAFVQCTSRNWMHVILPVSPSATTPNRSLISSQQ
jgi:hypothetical protein